MNSQYIAKRVLDAGGIIRPLYVPPTESGVTGLMNPSIFNDNGKLIVVLRNVNNTFYHSEKKLFQHQWGPLTYVHPENDMHLRTTNHYLELDENLNTVRHNKIDTSKFDTYKPLWDFVGLEDARVVRWNEKLYIAGVRRDTTTNGQGRMELSEIQVNDDSVVEVSRFRIPPPKDQNSYCEKNWMPVIDKPFHFVKWCNPTEVVKVDPELKTSETVYLDGGFPVPRDLRGGSQVIPFGDYYLTCTHEVDLFKSEVGRKDGIYRHRFILWDKNWNPIKASKDFSFLSGHVEFCVGMTEYEDDILMTFGFQDNAAYIIRSPKRIIEEIINEC